MNEQESIINILNNTQHKAHEKGYEEGVRDGIVIAKKEMLHFLLQKMDLPKAIEYLHLTKEEAEILLDNSLK